MNVGSSDMMEVQRRTQECLSQAGSLTPQVEVVLQKIIRAAMRAGQSHARLQLLRLGRHFAYAEATADDDPSYLARTATLTLHDAWTHAVIRERRVHLSSLGRALVEWILRQGLQPMCSTLAVQRERAFNQPAPADYIYVSAVFVPLLIVREDDSGPASAISAWNTRYVHKCLDTSMIAQWNERCIRALRAGLTHFVVCALYRPTDFDVVPDDDDDDAADKSSVLHHLTMQPMGRERFCLHRRFAQLLAWVHQLGYRWILTSDAGDAAWAYFCVLLEPLMTFHTLV